MYFWKHNFLTNDINQKNIDSFDDYVFIEC